MHAHQCRWLNDTFGKTPTIGWQIDPFGHSATHASLIIGLGGYDALFFGRADYQARPLLVTRCRCSGTAAPARCLCRT